MLQKDNPFRKPAATITSRRAWRLDNTIGNFSDSVEIIIPAGLSLTEYQMRYVKKPQPIVLTDLTTGEFEGQGLSIDGVTSEQTSELNSIVHRQIIDRAVELAIEAYEKSRIQTFPMVASRNE